MTTNALYNDALKAAAATLSDYPPLEAPAHRLELDNMFCGDKVRIDLTITDGTVSEVGCKAWGCLLTKASLAVLMNYLPGKPASDIHELERMMGAFLKEKAEEILATLPDAEMFTPVQDHKSRQDCVMLPFSAVKQGGF